MAEPMVGRVKSIVAATRPTSGFRERLSTLLYSTLAKEHPIGLTFRVIQQLGGSDLRFLETEFDEYGNW